MKVSLAVATLESKFNTLTTRFQLVLDRLDELTRRLDDATHQHKPASVDKIVIGPWTFELDKRRLVLKKSLMLRKALALLFYQLNAKRIISLRIDTTRNDEVRLTNWVHELAGERYFAYPHLDGVMLLVTIPESAADRAKQTTLADVVNEACEATDSQVIEIPEVPPARC